MTDRCLIGAAFPLKQVFLDSVHEKNVRYGHISALHTWLARRPLPASRRLCWRPNRRAKGDDWDLEAAEWNWMVFGAKMCSVMEASLVELGRERE